MPAPASTNANGTSTPSASSSKDEIMGSPTTTIQSGNQEPPQIPVEEKRVSTPSSAFWEPVLVTLEERTQGEPPIVPFGGSAAPQKEPNREIVGGKGLGLQEMTRIGVEVPPGFTLSTPLCQIYDEHGDLPPKIWESVVDAVRRIEADMGRKYGDPQNPLLFSCRSGAAISMPGMMDTVLNIGLNSDTVKGLAKATDNPRFAYDAFRRLLDMYGQVVLEIPHEAFEERFDAIKAETGVTSDVEMDAEHLKQLCDVYKQVYTDHKHVFPEDPYEQLFSCVKAVFGSWQSERAIKYREINGITNLIGTACNIQTMVFGNMGNDSGTGVAFSRNPSTGEKKLYGEYLINAQGEDVVAGIRTPEPISKMSEVLPQAYRQFTENVQKLEEHFHDMQDVEFTVEKGKLWMLQCRSGKRTGRAALRIAIGMATEGLCTKEEALLSIEPAHIKQLLHPAFTPEALKAPSYKENVIAQGFPGGPGAAVGKIVFCPKKAEAEKDKGEQVVLVRNNTSPEDVGGMWAAVGVLTAHGGMTSHAAVVARGWGKPCVCGCGELEIDEHALSMTVKNTGEVYHEGDVISINGNTGEVLRIAIETSTPDLGGDMSVVLGWADAVHDSMKVLTNADSGVDAAWAADLGAQGIGLCRTEHMFFAPDRLPVVRRWILRGEDLDKVREFQRTDFRAIFKAMNDKPVTIRMLDPPLHEFLPKESQVDEAMTESLGYGTDKHALIEKIESMNEENPMLGLRGCRLAIVRPELTVMQVEAIMHAAADWLEEDPADAHPRPRIMIPLVGNVAEFKQQAIMVKRTAERVKRERKVNIHYEIGTMIEVPRAALISDTISCLKDPTDGKLLCDFFSYGTNDLTQMTLGISRDDSAVFVPTYIQLGIFETDPFQSIDVEGVGYLVHKSAAEGRLSRDNLSLSVCGEHGGDPKSIAFFDKIGLDYVSCSPFRVPVARLATAQSAIRRHIKQKVALDAQMRVRSFFDQSKIRQSY